MDLPKVNDIKKPFNKELGFKVLGACAGAIIVLGLAEYLGNQPSLTAPYYEKLMGGN